MTRSERCLMILLRVVGAVSVLAIVAVFMPHAWMAWCHEMLGLGPFPDAPVAEYLARSVSLFYALLGGVQLWLSTDVRRYGRVIIVVGVGTITCGMVLLSVDMRAGMPWWWTAAEGPFVVALGVAYLLLQMRVRSEIDAAGVAGQAGEGGEVGDAGREAADPEEALNP